MQAEDASGVKLNYYPSDLDSLNSGVSTSLTSDDKSSKGSPISGASLPRSMQMGPPSPYSPSTADLNQRIASVKKVSSLYLYLYDSASGSIISNAIKHSL